MGMGGAGSAVPPVLTQIGSKAAGAGVGRSSLDASCECDGRCSGRAVKGGIAMMGQTVAPEGGRLVCGRECVGLRKSRWQAVGAEMMGRGGRIGRRSRRQKDSQPIHLGRMGRLRGNPCARTFRQSGRKTVK